MIFFVFILRLVIASCLFLTAQFFSLPLCQTAIFLRFTRFFCLFGCQCLCFCLGALFFLTAGCCFLLSAFFLCLFFCLTADLRLTLCLAFSGCFCFLLRLQSPRTARPGPLAAHGKQSFGIRGELPGQARRILWTPDAPDLRVNGEPRKDQRSYLADSYPVVWMGNDDLSLVQAGADARRKYMDFLGSQWHPGYRLALFSYRRALKTRNYLLKHRHRDKLQLDAYTRQLALHGTELKSLRASLLTLLAPHITLAYRSIGGREEQVAVAYRASEEGDLYERLCAAVDRDIRYGQTQNGPHRDDLDITLNGRSAAQFASEGQQRTIAISMKLAQSSLLTEETGHTPIHLIDDVFGELDPTRRVAFLQSLPADAQSLITTTHLDWLHDTPCPLPSFRLEDSTLKPL